MAESIIVVLDRFDELLHRGLSEILAEDPSIRVVQGNTQRVSIRRADVERTRQVRILDEQSVTHSAVLCGLQAIRPAIGIIVLAARIADTYSERTLLAGTLRLFKDAAAADLIAAVHLVAGQKRRPSSLTAREAEVLECLSLGYSYAETAEALWISVETVRTHSARIRCKLGVRSKHELIVGPSRSCERAWTADSPRMPDATRPATLQKITP